MAKTTPKKLYRSSTDRVLLGVCGGLAQYMGADPTVVRLITVVLALVTGVVPLTVAYFIAALVIPSR